MNTIKQPTSQLINGANVVPSSKMSDMNPGLAVAAKTDFRRAIDVFPYQ